MASDYEFTMPLSVYLPRKTKDDVKFSVNLNAYRNAHHRLSNDAKKAYCERMKDQLTSVEPVSSPIHISYTYYAKINNSPDLDNFASAGIKFFQDAMVNHGFIKDDNVHFIPSYSVKYGGIDRDNPRIVARVTILN